MPAFPGLQRLQHHLLPSTTLPYITSSSPTESKPHYQAGSNVVSNIGGFVSKRPGFATDTADNLAETIQRLFVWQTWAGVRFKMLATTTGSLSKVYKLKIGTDAAYSLIFTSSVAA